MTNDPFGAGKPVASASTSTALLDRLVDVNPRCVGPHPKADRADLRFAGRPCGHLLALGELTRPWSIKCRCGYLNER